LLKDRQDRIAKDISDAKEASESAAAMKAEYESKLKNIEKEAEAILSEARQKALKNEQRIVDEAKDEARRIVKHAQDEALLEQKRAMDDVKKEIITVAGLMAQKVVSANIDTNIQDSLVEETLKEMGDSTWLS
jgi:F-type H+-transporting ATPase subunit b